jgi:prepilin-type processing-associated H-X9-DG protein
MPFHLDGNSTRVFQNSANIAFADGMKTGAAVALRNDTYIARTNGFDANSSDANGAHSGADIAVSCDSHKSTARTGHTNPAIALRGNGCRSAGCSEGCRSFASICVSGRRFCSEQRTSSYNSCNRPESLAQHALRLLCAGSFVILSSIKMNLSLTNSK